MKLFTVNLARHPIDDDQIKARISQLNPRITVLFNLLSMKYKEHSIS